MKRFHLRSICIITGFFSILAAISTQAQDQQTTSVTTTTSQTPEGGTLVKTVKIITPVPAAKEVVAAPEGYVTCFTVQEGWFNDFWVPTHQVCQYDNAADGIVWIEGYWGCNVATAEGVCSNWEWRAGHWEKKLAVY